MALGNKSLSPICAPDLVDIATYFFFKKKSIRYQNVYYKNVIFGRVLSPFAQSMRARLIENPPTKYCGSAAVVRCGGRVGDIWGADPRFGPRSSSGTATPSCFCPELGRHLPIALFPPTPRRGISRTDSGGLERSDASDSRLAEWVTRFV